MGQDTPPFRYGARLAREIEQRWQGRSEREGTFHAANPVGPGARLGAGHAGSGRPPALPPRAERHAAVGGLLLGAYLAQLQHLVPSPCSR